MNDQPKTPTPMMQITHEQLRDLVAGYCGPSALGELYALADLTDGQPPAVGGEAARCMNCDRATVEQCDDAGCGYLGAGNGAPASGGDIQRYTMYWNDQEARPRDDGDYVRFEDAAPLLADASKWQALSQLQKGLLGVIERRAERLQSELGRANARIAELEAAQGEAVAWEFRRIDPEEGQGDWQVMNHEPHMRILESNGSYEINKLYRQAQPAMAKVALPERRELSQSTPYLSDLDHEWNACLDEIAKLNPPNP